MLNITDLKIKIGTSTVIKDISFQVIAGSKLAIAGETGSGKSSLLKAIAGLQDINEGYISYEGERVKGASERLIPGHPKISYLSQHYELRHHYTVKDWLEHHNQLEAAKAYRLYEICRIAHLLNRKTEELSGGEKQRIALARLLTGLPKLLLLDEPFSNLDMIHKSILKKVLEEVGLQYKMNFILTSHDPMDILSWADEIILLKEGQLIQQDAPQRMYHYPKNEYAAAMLGIYNKISFGLFQKLGGRFFSVTQPFYFVRPEKLQLIAANGVEGTIEDIRFWGSYYDMLVRIGNETIIIRSQELTAKRGESVKVQIKSGKI